MPVLFQSMRHAVWHAGALASRLSVEIGTLSTVMAIAHAGLRSTFRGSSTSTSMTSLGKGVAVIKVTPSDE